MFSIRPLPVIDVSVGPLYRRILGTKWMMVDVAVRKAHFNGQPLSRSGIFQVTHGQSKLARVLIRVLRLPDCSLALAVHLNVDLLGQREKWMRTFGQRVLTSLQSEVKGGFLNERVRIFNLQFRLEVLEGSLVYEQVSAAMRIGPVSIPLPNCVAPVVKARESASDDGSGTHVLVTVTSPLTGLLFSYHGHLHKDEPI